VADLLPPAVQQFVVDAAGYVAGIDEMVTANVRLAESIKVTQTEMRTMQTTAASVSSMTGAAAASTKTAADADLRLAEAERAVAQQSGATSAALGKEAAAANETTAASTRLRDAQGRYTAGEKEAAAASTQAAVSHNKAAESLTKLGKMTTLAGVAFAASSVHMAAGFDQAMAMIHTQAGAADEDIKKLGNQVLSLSGTVGIGPEKLATGLYHVESAGYRGKAAMDILASASKLAAIGQSDFEKTSQAVVGVMSSEIRGVKDAADAGALLNTTVGIGDMRMDQLAQSIATGILPKAKAAGLSFQDVGAALATLTDNVTPADEAATRLGMTFSMMSSTGTPKARKALEQVGMTSVQLANVIRSKGLYQALVDLQTHLDKTYPPSQKLKLSLDEQRKELGNYKDSLTASGLSVAQQGPLLEKFKAKLTESGSAAVQQSKAISDMFGGGKSSGAILTLMGEMDRFKTKTEAYGTAASRAKQMQASWAEQQKQFSQQVKDLEAKFQVLQVRIGNFLIPKLQALAGFFVKHQTLAKALAAVIVSVLTVAVVAFGVKTAVSAAKATASFVKLGVDGAKGLAHLAQGFSSSESAAASWSGRMGSLGGKARQAASGIASFSGGAAATKKTAASMSATLAKAAYGYTVMGLKAAAAAVQVGAAKAASAAMAALDMAGMLAKAAAGYALLGLKAAWSAIQLVAVKTAELAVQVATEAWTAIQWALDAAMDANPIGLVVVAIAALVAGVIYAYTHFKTFHKIIDTIFSWIKSHWPLLLAIITGPIGLAVLFIVKHWTAIKNAFSTAINWVVNFVKQHWPLLLAIITGPIGIAVFLVIKYWKQISGAVSSAVSWVVAFVKQHWPLLLAILTGPIGLAVLYIVKHWDAIVGFFRSGVARVKTILNWFVGLPKMFNGWFMAAYHAVVSALTSLVNYVAGIPGKVYNALKHIYNDMLGIGKNIVIGIWNGLVSMGSWLYNSLMSWVSSMIPGPIKKVLGISSPSKLMHGYGQNIGQGLAAGMLSRYDHVRAAAEGLAKTAAAGVNKTVQGSVALNLSAHSGDLSGQLVASMTRPGGSGYLGGGSSTQGGTTVIVNMHVAGTIAAQRDVEKGLQKAVLRANVRNPTNTLSLPAGR